MSDTRHPTPTRKTALAPDVRRLDERAARAWTERMAVRRLADDRYVVESEGGTYVVDLDEHSCTCPDYQIRGEVCKHLRRVAIEITTRRVPPPGHRRANCAACGVETFAAREADPGEASTGASGTAASRDADPPLCETCHLDPGDVVRDLETGDRLVVAHVTADRANERRVGPDDRLVADYETNADYPRDDLVAEAVYLGDYRRGNRRTYSFPRSRLERTDDAQLVD